MIYVCRSAAISVVSLSIHLCLDLPTHIFLSIWNQTVLPRAQTMRQHSWANPWEKLAHAGSWQASTRKCALQPHHIHHCNRIRTPEWVSSQAREARDRFSCFAFEILRFWNHILAFHYSVLSFFIGFWESGLEWVTDKLRIGRKERDRVSSCGQCIENREFWVLRSGVKASTEINEIRTLMWWKRFDL